MGECWTDADRELAIAAAKAALEPFQAGEYGDLLLGAGRAARIATEAVLDALVVAYRPESSTEVDTATAAVKLGVTPVRVRQLIRDGRLSARRAGGAWLVEAFTLDQYSRYRRGRRHDGAR